MRTNKKISVGIAKRQTMPFCLPVCPTEMGAFLPLASWGEMRCKPNSNLNLLTFTQFKVLMKAGTLQ